MDDAGKYVSGERSQGAFSVSCFHFLPSSHVCVIQVDGYGVSNGVLVTLPQHCCQLCIDAEDVTTTLRAPTDAERQESLASLVRTLPGFDAFAPVISSFSAVSKKAYRAAYPLGNVFSVRSRTQQAESHVAAVTDYLPDAIQFSVLASENKIAVPHAELKNRVGKVDAQYDRAETVRTDQVFTLFYFFYTLELLLPAVLFGRRPSSTHWQKKTSMSSILPKLGERTTASFNVSSASSSR